MTDIVEALRDPSICYFTTDSRFEIADEIESMRTDNATLRTALRTHGEEAAKLVESRAAIGELVGLAQKLVNYWNLPPGEGGSAQGLIDEFEAAITKHDTSSTTTKGSN